MTDDTKWEFVCEGCRKATPEAPKCTVCGHEFTFRDPREVAMEIAHEGMAEYIASLQAEEKI